MTSKHSTCLTSEFVRKTSRRPQRGERGDLYLRYPDSGKSGRDEARTLNGLAGLAPNLRDSASRLNTCASASSYGLCIQTVSLLLLLRSIVLYPFPVSALSVSNNGLARHTIPAATRSFSSSRSWPANPRMEAFASDSPMEMSPKRSTPVRLHPSAARVMSLSRAQKRVLHLDPPCNS